MRILLIHTAGGEGSVALADAEGGRAVGATEVVPGRPSLRRLVAAGRRVGSRGGWWLGGGWGGVVAGRLAGYAVALVLGRIEAGDFDDAATLDANYLRRTDMEIFAKAAVRAENL